MITLRVEDNPKADLPIPCGLCGTEWEPPQDGRVFVAVFVSRDAAEVFPMFRGKALRDDEYPEGLLAGYMCRRCELSLVAPGGLQEGARQVVIPPRRRDSVREHVLQEIAAGRFVITPEVAGLMEAGMQVGNEVRRRIWFASGPRTRRGQAH